MDEFQRSSNEVLGRYEITSHGMPVEYATSVNAGQDIQFVNIGQAVQQVAKADPKNIQEVAASQLGIVNSYYQSGLQQSQQSFRWSLVWGGIGFAFLVVAVSVLLFRQPSEIAWVSVLAGAIIEVFAGTYLVLYKNTSDQLAAFRVSLEETQRLLLANSMCERLEGELEQTTRAEIIRQIVSSIVQGKQPSKEGEKRRA